MGNDRFKQGEKVGPGGTKGEHWQDTKTGGRGHTGHEKKSDGTYSYHEKDHKTGDIQGWTWNPSDPSKNSNTYKKGKG